MQPLIETSPDQELEIENEALIETDKLFISSILRITDAYRNEIAHEQTKMQIEHYPALHYRGLLHAEAHKLHQNNNIPSDQVSEELRCECGRGKVCGISYSIFL